MPQRIQRKRTKGWTTPLCSCGCGKKAIYVGRGSRWGNPFVIGLWYGAAGPNHEWTRNIKITDAQVATDEYRRAVQRNHPARDRTELRGHDLMCWCPLDSPCHADVLLELANNGGEV